jgi:hypothetical protein
MFQGLARWWHGENVTVEIIQCRNEINANFFPHTLVSCSDGARRWVKGHLGSPGEKITVNTWDLNKY